MVNLLMNDTYTNEVNPEALERAAAAVLQHHPDTPEGDLSIVIEDDQHLHNLNKEFLDIDAATDVLSFPSGETDVDPETGVFYLGDVIISYPRALEQAAASGHSVQDELQLLVVHGVLHLLGFDHAEPDEKAKMWAAQAEILSNLGVRLSRLPE